LCLYHWATGYLGCCDGKMRGNDDTLLQ
jgi:hypothetical protein